MRGRPKKIKTTESIVNSKYYAIVHCYLKLQNAIVDLKEAVGSIQVQYEQFPAANTVRENVYHIDRKIVFDNVKFEVESIQRTMSEYLAEMVRQTDDMKWCDHVKEEEK